ncbi:MAG: fatty acid desaturase [Cyanobacteria bacterium SZAS LIN-3]|nr:fatty acid desaturase [Cyanobacteria bacterium SZAS LIN-3]
MTDSSTLQQQDPSKDINVVQSRLRQSVSSADLKEWLTIRTSRSYLDIGVNWLSIVLGWACLALFGLNALTLTAAFFLIGFGQYGLFILGHDGLHGCLHPKLPQNDRICRWLIYSPMLMGFEDGRRNHLEHHKRLGHEDDPDRYLHRMSDKNSFLSLLAFCLGIKTFLKTVIKVSPVGALRAEREKALSRQQARAAAPAAVPEIESAAPENPEQASYHDLPIVRTQTGSVLKTYVVSRLPVALWQLTIIGLLLFVLKLPWWLYLTHWIATIYFCVFLADEIRAFCDHAIPQLPDEAVDYQRLVTFTPNLAEKIAFAPHSMHLHAEHHLFPRVPYYNRLKVHQQLKDQPEITIRKSYVAFMTRLFAALPLKTD